MAEQKKEVLDLIKSINELLSQSNINDVTSESNSFRELPEGYYLATLNTAKITTSSKNKPMVALTFTVAEDGLRYAKDKDDTITIVKNKGTKNQKIFMYYVLVDSASLRRFVSDMLKFEGEEEGKPLVDKECFLNYEVLETALQVLENSNIYIQITKSEKDDGSTSTWQNLISWKRARALDLPM